MRHVEPAELAVPEPEPVEHHTVLPPRVLLLVFGLSGFSGISYEILWTRIATLFQPNAQTIIFTLVLFLYLVGTGIGSAAYGWLRGRSPLRLYGVLQLVVGSVAVSAPLLLEALRHHGPTSWNVNWIPMIRLLDLHISPSELITVVAAVGLPALCFGMMFPVGNRLYVRRFSLLGAGVGAVYFFSTVGGILGSFACGFLLMPWLTAKGCLMALGGLNLTLGILLVLVISRGTRLQKMLCGGLATGAVVAVTVWLALTVPPWIFIDLPSQFQFVHYRDGRSTTDGVLVEQFEQSGHSMKLLFANGEVIGSDQSEIWVPLALHPAPRRLMVLAFATGNHPAKALEHPLVERVECVDISDVQDQLASHFTHYNDNVMKHPRFTLVSNDGRNHLLTRQRSYDVIFSAVAVYASYLELSTREYFGLCRRRLARGGIYVHRLHPEMLSVGGLRRIARTFTEVFPRSALIVGRADGVLLLVGWNGRGKLLLSDIEAAPRYNEEQLYTFAARMLLDGEALARLGRGVAPLVDDRPPRLGDIVPTRHTTMRGASHDPGPEAGRGPAFRRLHSTIIQHLAHPSRFFRGLSSGDLPKIIQRRKRSEWGHPL